MTLKLSAKTASGILGGSLGVNLISTTNDILSNNGTIVLGGVGGTNNENLTWDFESEANHVLLSSSTGAILIPNLTVRFPDGAFLQFNTSGAAAFKWEIEGNDNFQFGIRVGGVGQSGYFSIMEREDMGNANRSPLAISADPVLRIYSSDATQALDLLEFYHNQTQPVINWGNGNLLFAGGNIELLDTTTSELGVIYKGSDRFIHNFHHPTGGGAVPVGRNTFIGINAGNFTMGSTATSVNNASRNVGIGNIALDALTTGQENTAIGASVLTTCTTGNANMGVGYIALGLTTTGDENIAIGRASLFGNIDGSGNTGIGYHAGRYIADGSTPNETSNQGVFIGRATKASADGVDRETVIGNNAIGKGSDTVILGAEGANTRVYATGGLTVNDEGFDVDTIIKGLGDNDLFYVDAGNDRIGIGTGIPTVKLQIDGFIAPKTISGITASTTRTQGNGDLTAQINEIAICATTDDTVTLPAAVTGIECVIINNGAETLQIFPALGDNLGAGVDLPEELETNETVQYVAYDDTNWKKEATTEIIHAEMHDEDNTDPFAINDAGGDFHCYHTNGLAEGDLADWTFDIGGGGTSNPIASIADGADSGVDIAVTTTGTHGLAVGDIISQTNLATAAYVGIFEVKAIISTTIYEVAAVFDDDVTGTVDQASTVIAGVGSSGVYSLSYWISATLPVGNNETFDFQLYKEASAIPGTKVRRKFGTATDFGSMSGGGVVFIADGDKISLALSNEDSAADITIRNFTLVLTRL